MAAMRRPIWRTLYFWVLVAIALGILTGWAVPRLRHEPEAARRRLHQAGQDDHHPGHLPHRRHRHRRHGGAEGRRPVGRKAIAYFLTVSTLALIIGLVVANVVQPGAGMNVDPASASIRRRSSVRHQAHDQSVVDFLLEHHPEDCRWRLHRGQILQVLFFSILFGVGLAVIGEGANR